MKLCILFDRKLAAGEHDDGHVGQRIILADVIEYLETAHVRQPYIEYDAVARGLAQGGKRSRAGIGCDDLDVVVVQQLPYAHLFRRIVLHNQQALAAGPGVLLDLRQRRADPLGRRWFADIRKRAAGESVLPVFVQRDDLNRNVSGQRVVLQLTEHRPAQHIGQEHIERHRGGLELLGEIQRLGTAGGDQDLETLVASQVYQDARIMRIVLDNQKNRVPRFEIQPVVRELLDDTLRRRDLQRRHSAVLRRALRRG